MGHVLFWKLNAEAFLAASGLSVAIVKPCGLYGAGMNSTLLVGKDDSLFSVAPPIVSRDDVARVMLAGLSFGVTKATDEAAGAPLSLRFDLCSKAGPVTTDLHALISGTLWPWQSS